MPTDPVLAALTALDLARAGRFEQIRDLFAPSLRAMVTAESIQAAWAAQLDRHGPVSSVGTPVSDPAGPQGVLVKVPLAFARERLTLLVSVVEGGWLTGIQFAPAGAASPVEPWQPPEYADPEAFEEQEVTIGTGPLAVPGTLSLPRRPGPRPAIVLLPGSGPLDRDETIGRNKPLKDLAWGLASRGIAVLRFDKVTHVHGARLAGVADFTMVDEYVPHAVAAVTLLRGHPAVGEAPVFVLGHSLGGTVAPRVAAAEPSVAGLVLLAGGAQPMHWAAVRQLRYLATLEPGASAASQPAIDAMTRQATTVERPDLDPATPASELPFGVPAPYWLDVRGYDPVAAAAALDKPILILQGGRDYQTTVADDLARWRAGLMGHENVTIRVYDADNHLFFPGEGPSSPTEYEPAQHLDPAVVADLATWLTRPVEAGRVADRKG
ncbi:alpha/beta hydrolase [Rugosimonospora acidiphila]|uniref:Alpha/beta hydrolase n=1 Tax=Rugosimonospora acidiphila TaxID=556531 RepID=A0ABP9SQF7_9ACTN